jgi:D-beta-D-heptose 7-phosphate kinase/D-beta-D-heptose 1-phosphate adenosyltransferase
LGGMRPSSLLSLLDEFPRRRVLVVGDALLDHYVMGVAHRISVEAPVPILHAQADSWNPGGAANVVHNLAQAGARVTFVGVVGDDEAGQRLASLLSNMARVDAQVVVDSSRPTPLKTRFVAQNQQMLRVDREDPGPPAPKVAAKVRALLTKALRQCDGVIVSDYAKGLLQPALLQELMAQAKNAGREVLVDPKGTDYRRYHGATLITPNDREAREASGLPAGTDEEVAKAAGALRRIVGAQAVCITRGARGIGVFPRHGKPAYIPARRHEVYDTTGAGDTTMALLALARFSGASFVEAAELGNIAAGIVVTRAGVAAPTIEELREEVGNTEFWS